MPPQPNVASEQVRTTTIRLGPPVIRMPRPTSGPVFVRTADELETRVELLIARPSETRDRVNTEETVHGRYMVGDVAAALRFSTTHELFQPAGR